MRILIVEDEPSDRRRIESILLRTATGAVVDHVESCSDACMLLMNRKIDVVLLDLSLPDSAGSNTVHSVYRAAPQVPIIVMSGFEDVAMAMRCVRAGATSYVVKNGVTAELMERELLFAVERHRREMQARGMVQVLAASGTLQPHADAIDQTLHRVMYYLALNHPVAAQAVESMLLKGGAAHALQELRSYRVSVSDLEPVALPALPEPNPEPGLPRVPVDVVIFLGLLLGALLAFAFYLRPM